MSPRTRRWLLSALIFAVAFGIRLLTWHDTRSEVGKVQYGVTADYRRMAERLHAGSLESFFNSSSPLANPGTLGHPIGYPILLAATGATSSDSSIQLVQITVDALSAVVIFLIVLELFSLTAATFAGLFAAFAPQFAWNSVLLLPDTLAVFPILAAVYALIRATRKPRIITFILVGALIGISCWLRANAMLLTIFFAAAVPLLIKNPIAWRYALAILGGTILLIAPLTIRNAIVFHRFIPVSLGAGQTLLEGLADYDPQRRFGIPPTDVEIQQQEAESYDRPEYAQALFEPDGIERERARLSRGVAVIRSHPFWFAGVMARRASMMLRLERTPRSSRLAIQTIQRCFITAVFLPLAIFGLLVVIFRKQSRSLVILSIVPLYYFIVQSTVHTEYRYVLAVVDFLFAFAAVGVTFIGELVFEKLRALVGLKSAQPSKSVPSA